MTDASKVICVNCKCELAECNDQGCVDQKPGWRVALIARALNGTPRMRRVQDALITAVQRREKWPRG